MSRQFLRTNYPSCFSLCVLCVLCGYSSLQAVSPSLGSITPRGAQRGTEAVLLFNGNRLSDAAEIIFYTPGFSVSKLEVVGDNQTRATIKIAPDCQLGEHTMRVRTKTGISELRTFWVGALAIVDEKEPNSEFEKPQKIELNVTAVGVANAEDVDYYAVEMKKGQRLSVEVEGMRLANTFFDPHVAILDSKRFELASSDDSPLNKQDGLCSVVVPADGTYIVQVRESAFGGNGACQYRLHVGTFPRPTAVYPIGGKAGEEVEVRFLGDPTGEIKQKFKLPAQADPNFKLFCQDATGISPSGLPFRVIDVGNTLEVEPNDVLAQATKGEFPSAFNGVIEKEGDGDMFRFAAKKGQVYDVHCYGRRIGSPLDPVMVLYNAAGSAIVSNDDSAGPDSYFRWSVPADGEYVLHISDHLKKGGPTYTYRVEFQPVVATSTVTIPKVALYSQERQTIVVPKGNRFATLISAGRGNWGGDAVYGAEGMPAGMKLTADTLLNGYDVFPVVFEADANATVGGTLGQLTCLPVDPKVKVQSQFSQRLEMIVSGPGQSIYWTANVNRTAFAVAEEVPFRIHIVEPKAPIVQNGTMNLKVIAERKAGFTGPITITPLWNPPGLSSASSATIAENQTETVLPMNAAANAAIRKWKTAVLGTATVGNGPAWVSSQLATIEVAAPFVTLNMERTASEQGKDTELFCKVQMATPFEGKAKVRLIGLPANVTTTDLEIDRETKELGFKLTIPKTAQAGQHRNLFCQVVLTHNGETVQANTGSSELRIDVPIVPKVAVAPMPMPMKTPMSMTTPMKPPEKRLSRLEKLRLEQQEREKALQGGEKK